jgi:hypothetical protein
MKDNKNGNAESFAKLAELCTYLVKNNIATKNDTIESIFAKMMDPEIAKKKEVNKPIKKEIIDVPKVIRKVCQDNEDIFILSMAKNFAILMKRKEEVITRVLGEGTMNPVEQQKDVIYFDCFAFYWTLSSNDKPILQLEKLSEYGFPIYHVETEYDINTYISEF